MKRDKNHRMRVAFLGGGAHTIPSYRTLLKMLSKDFEITLYSEFYIGPNMFIEEYKVKSVPSWKLSGRIKELLFGLIVLLDQIKNRAQIIHSHSTFPSGLVAILIGKLFRIPTLVSLDAAEMIGLNDIKFGDLLRSRRATINRFVLNRATVITALTEYQGNLVKENIKFDHNIHVIPRGIDCSRFQFNDRLPQPPFRFLNVAYLHPVKDQVTLLKCFSILSQSMSCSLTQVGQDYTNGEIKKISDQLGLSHQLSFTGFIPHEKIHTYYKEADVLLHTAVYESQGVVVAEALASGLLVCGTQVGLMADLSEICCQTVKPGDAEGLANIVLTLLGDSDKMKKVKALGRQWAEEFDIKWTTEQYASLYKSLLR